MKKLFIILFAGISFASCMKKECNCGVITDDAITWDQNGNACYSLSIRNSCSSNVKTWCFNSSVWYQNAVGDNFCVDGVGSW